MIDRGIMKRFSVCLCVYRKSFKLAFELLQGTARTDCQSIIVFATDGVDDDGDPVRCGPGYYTRSGYVPGQICKYDWNDVWDEVAARNRYMSPRVSWYFLLTHDNLQSWRRHLDRDTNLPHIGESNSRFRNPEHV